MVVLIPNQKKNGVIFCFIMFAFSFCQYFSNLLLQDLV